MMNVSCFDTARKWTIIDIQQNVPDNMAISDATGEIPDIVHFLTRSSNQAIVL